MVKQYPHNLYISETPEDSLGEDGNWDIGTSTSETPDWILFSECREEPNGAAGTQGGNDILTSDGVYMVYSSIIYIPKTADQFIFRSGDRIRVTGEDEEERLVGVVKRFSSDVFHNRIWV